MSVSGGGTQEKSGSKPELTQREWRMAIMIAVYAASSTKGADHDILKFEFI